MTKLYTTSAFNAQINRYNIPLNVNIKAWLNDE
jgi:hypothetical protein